MSRGGEEEAVKLEGVMMNVVSTYALQFEEMGEKEEFWRRELGEVMASIPMEERER